MRGGQASGRRQLFPGGALLRELEAEAGELPGSALTEPLTVAVTEAIEALWCALGLEADRVVKDARQPFERYLKAEQTSRVQAEAPTMRTQEHLQATRSRLVGLEKALAVEHAARGQTSHALEQERLAHTRTDTQREAVEALAAERQQLCDEALAERDALRVELDSVRGQTDALTQELRRELSDQRTVEVSFRDGKVTRTITTSYPPLVGITLWITAESG